MGDSHSSGGDLPSHLHEQTGTETNMFRISRARAFVNRADELGRVASQLDLLMRGGVVRECVSNFSGVPGIGKSVLLGKIADTWYGAANLRVLEIDIAKIYHPQRQKQSLSAPGSEKASNDSPRLRFLQSMVDGVILPAEPQRDIFVALVNELTPESSDEAFDAALASLSDLLIAQHQPVLLLVDSWDIAPDVLPPWLERVFLLPLVNNNRILAIFGSQIVMRWWQFEIRRRAWPHALEPLTKDESARQIGCPPEQIELVHSLTYGYPLANEYLYNELAHFATAHEIIEAEPRLMHGILTQVRSRVLTQISEELERVLQIMTLFREFDVSTLRTVLPRFYPEFGIRSQSSLMMSLKELLATRLVNWNEAARAYEFERTIRRIYVKTLRVTNATLYENIRETAINYYLNIIDEDDESSTIYLVEYCYHALYKHADHFYNEIHILRNTLSSLFKRVYGIRNGEVINSDGLQDVLHRLEQDEEICDALVSLNAPSDWFVQLAAELPKAATTH